MAQRPHRSPVTKTGSDLNSKPNCAAHTRAKVTPDKFRVSSRPGSMGLHRILSGSGPGLKDHWGGIKTQLHRHANSP